MTQPALYQHQMWTDTARGLALAGHGACRPAPEVVACHNTKPRDTSRQRGGFFLGAVSNPCRSDLILSGRSFLPVGRSASDSNAGVTGAGVECITALRPAFSIQALDHVPAKFADRPHPSNPFLNRVLVGIDPNESGLTHAQASFASGAKRHD